MCRTRLSDGRRAARRTFPGRQSPRGQAPAIPPGSEGQARRARPLAASPDRHNQDRHAGVACHLEYRSGRFVGEAEGLRPRVELDSSRSQRQAALCLGDRLLGRIQTTKREQPIPGFARPPQHAVVGRPVRGPAVRVMEREYAGSGGAVDLIEVGDQARELQRLPILVLPRWVCASTTPWRLGRSSSSSAASGAYSELKDRRPPTHPSISGVRCSRRWPRTTRSPCDA